MTSTVKFIDNKYTRTYFKIINDRAGVLAGYTENHHIIPKALGGDNSKENLVRLTAREHFICHWLLTKMLSEPQVFKMHLALSKMCSSSSTQYRYKPTSRHYQVIRENCARANSGKNNPMYGKTHNNTARTKISNATLAYNRINGPRTHTEETKRKIAETRTGIKHTAETKAKVSASKKGCVGIDNNSGKHWFNDGSHAYLRYECPVGCVPGRSIKLN